MKHTGTTVVKGKSLDTWDVFILRDRETGLFFNRARMREQPAIYDIGTAKRFHTRYNGHRLYFEHPIEKLERCDLEIVRCRLKEKEILNESLK